MNPPYAHLGGSNGKPHDLIDHLRAVAELARNHARAACPHDPQLAALAECAGWLHDLGKARPEFQDYLLGKRRGGPETRHAVFGAAGTLLKRLPMGAVLAILGHHAGLHDFGEAQNQLKDPTLIPLEAAKTLVADLDQACGAELSLPSSPLREFLTSKARGAHIELEDELRIRMLFSCLVDADYLDTEHYMTGQLRQSTPLQAGLLFERLDAYVRELTTGATPTPVNAARRELYETCVRAATQPRGCFSLTAPTGSGKTLAAMAFALKHAETHGLRRVIVVLPFLAIIEQNARVYRKALCLEGDPADVVLEHHSATDSTRPNANDGADDDPLSDNETQTRLRAKQATENWDAPVIVTTAVQFLESLFARRPSRCRKLHHIAQSVVIFDEVQTLPFKLLDPIMSAVRDLRTHFGVSFALGSATLPRLERSNSLPCGFRAEECREIATNPRQTFRILRRTRLELPCLESRPWTWSDLADRLDRNAPRALIIVNLRQHAQTLYDHLKNAGFPGLFHLSSTMCPAHREAVLGTKDNPKPGTISHALAQALPCLVVATQVVEAGVDIDFPIVFRAIAPLDAIIQAAGRCDREGTATESTGQPAGRVIVFKPAESEVTPPGFYTEATKITCRLLSRHAADPDRLLDDPELFAAYHAELIALGIGRQMSQAIQNARNAINFKTVDQLFRLIDEAGQGVVVPYGDADKITESIRLRGYVSMEDRRRLQRYTVNLYPTSIAHFGPQLRPILGADTSLLRFEGLYEKEALGIRLGELLPESFLV